MNEEAKVIFDKILRKSISSLTEWDIKFLKARRDYLNETQLGFYSVLFDGKPSTYASDSDPKEVDPVVEGPSYKELQAKAKELGLKYVGVKADKLKIMIEQAIK